MQAESQGQDANNPDIQVLHQQLVDKVKAAGHITSPRVEEAFRAVPRHLFLPHVPLQEVYQDRPIMTKMIDGQYVSSSSQPTIMAIMLEQLDLQPGHRVLEIGAGTGYNAALMAHIVGETGQVVTIDLDEDIVEAARTNLTAAGYERIHVVCADGGSGYPDVAPYDRIILTVSSADITSAWREQLRPDGRFVLPLVVRGPQLSVAFSSQPDTNYWESDSIRACGFVGLRGAFAVDGNIFQLSPEPEQFILSLGTPRSINATRILALLQGPYQDLPTQVYTTPIEMFWSLNSWLAIHEPLFCEVMATGEAVTNGPLPGPTNLMMSTQAVKIKRVTGLLSSETLVLLYPTLRATQQTSTPATTLENIGQSEQVGQPATQFLPSLHVRSYGDDDTLAEHLIEQVQAWDVAGHPDVQRLHIRAYRRDDMKSKTDKNANLSEHEDVVNQGVINQAPTLGEGDIMIEGRWSRFVFNWQL